MKKFRVFTYRFKLTHDNGSLNMSVVASNLGSAKKTIMIAESCPKRAMKFLSRTTMHLVYPAD